MKNTFFCLFPNHPILHFCTNSLSLNCHEQLLHQDYLPIIESPQKTRTPAPPSIGPTPLPLPPSLETAKANKKGKELHKASSPHQESNQNLVLLPLSMKNTI